MKKASHGHRLCPGSTCSKCTRELKEWGIWIHLNNFSTLGSKALIQEAVGLSGLRSPTSPSEASSGCAQEVWKSVLSWRGNLQINVSSCGWVLTPVRLHSEKRPPGGEQVGSATTETSLFIWLYYFPAVWLGDSYLTFLRLILMGCSFLENITHTM